MIAVGPDNRGSVRFNNCAFWGPCNQIAKIAGRGTVGFGDCTFTQWGGKDGSRPAIQAQSGTVLIRGCEFRQNRPQIDLGQDVTRAVIAENVFTGPQRIANQSKGNVQIGLNVSSGNFSQSALLLMFDDENRGDGVRALLGKLQDQVV
jgi:hypothetical protein